MAAKELCEWCPFRGAFGTAFFNIVLEFQDASYFVEERLCDSGVEPAREMADKSTS